MFTIKSHFIGVFKVGDNISYNLQTLSLLYRYFETAPEEERQLLRKPIIIILVSIIEAVLYDLHYRIGAFTVEGVKSLSVDVLNSIRGKKIDELGKYITHAKKHDLFEGNDSRFYEVLDELRKLRNRVHIQNTKNHFEPDDSKAFSDARKQQAEAALEKVMRIMSAKYHRNESHHFVQDFDLPWNPYFK